MNRRKFIQKGALGSAAACTLPLPLTAASTSLPGRSALANYRVLATWNVEQAVAKAAEVLQANGSALDAVEQGCRVEEANPANQTVGYGGRPDREGEVTLDACIMDFKGRCGSVVYLRDFRHPVSVARKVMEETPHVMLAGEGARKFALEQGFEPETLLTDASRKDWEEWKERSDYRPVINIENHDTIGMLALDQQGNLSGACTTSGMAFKMAGRVGDSPIIGAGLYVDNEVGAATATGLGEAVLRSVGSFLVVELMRQGHDPNTACRMAVKRLARTHAGEPPFQVGFIAMNRRGETGAFSLQPGFSYREAGPGENLYKQSQSHYSKK